MLSEDDRRRLRRLRERTAQQRVGPPQPRSDGYGNDTDGRRSRSPERRDHTGELRGRGDRKATDTIRFLGRRGRVVRQRPAKPRTPVRFWSAPSERRRRSGSRTPGAYASPKALPPRLRVGAALGRLEEVLERDVNERQPGLGQQLARLPELSADVHPATFLVLDPGAHRERRVDRDRPPVAEEHPARDRREAVPGRDQPARLVDERGDHAAVRQARARPGGARRRRRSSRSDPPPPSPAGEGGSRSGCRRTRSRPGRDVEESSPSRRGAWPCKALRGQAPLGKC